MDDRLTPEEIEELRRRASEDLQKLLIMAKEQHAAQEEAKIMKRNAAHAKFEEGKLYSRQEMQDVLGGNLEKYLPHVDGEVVYGCLQLKRNPEAPNVVLVGDSPDVRRWADVFCEQTHHVPIFIKTERNLWKYMGNFRVKEWTDDKSQIDNYASKAGRDDVVKVLKLVKEPA